MVLHMTENIQLDTTINESIVGSEIDMLLFALERTPRPVPGVEGRWSGRSRTQPGRTHRRR